MAVHCSPLFGDDRWGGALSLPGPPPGGGGQFLPPEGGHPQWRNAFLRDHCHEQCFRSPGQHVPQSSRDVVQVQVNQDLEDLQIRLYDLRGKLVLETPRLEGGSSGWILRASRAAPTSLN